MLYIMVHNHIEDSIFFNCIFVIYFLTSTSFSINMVSRRLLLYVVRTTPIIFSVGPMACPLLIRRRAKVDL
jgi:hypothetical protein